MYKLALYTFVTLFSATLVSAAEFVKPEKVYGRWAVNVDENFCWISQIPIVGESKHERGGKSVPDNAVKRGEEYETVLSVVLEKGKEKPGYVYFTGGAYEFNTNEHTKFFLEIDGKQFTMKASNLDGIGASFSMGKDDTEIIELMIAGADASVSSVSKRNLISVDKFTLKDFTVSFRHAQKLCS